VERHFAKGSIITPAATFECPSLASAIQTWLADEEQHEMKMRHGVLRQQIWASWPERINLRRSHMHITNLESIEGSRVTGLNDEKLGKVQQVYVDTLTHEPAWLAIKTGLFGSHVSFVPLAGAVQNNGDIQVPYTKDQMDEAPNHDPDAPLTMTEEQQLFTHYGLDYGSQSETHRVPVGEGRLRRYVEMDTDQPQQRETGTRQTPR
jgi:PRC-barrel domain